MRLALHFLWKSGIWAPITVLVFHQFVWLKDWRTEIDWLNHYSGGLSLTYFAWKSSPYLFHWTGKSSPLGRLMIAFLSGCTATLGWEITEFSSDLFLNTAIQKSVNETMMDIVNGFLGTMTATLILGSLTFRNQRNVAHLP